MINTSEQPQQHVLSVIRVLVLVHEDVAEGLRPALLRLGEALQHLYRQHQHVVEVDRVQGEQLALVEAVHVGDRLVVEAADAGGVLVGPDQLVLRVRDLAVNAARGEALGVALELLEARADEPDLVGLIVDREVRAIAEPLGLAAEDAAAGGVEGHDPDRPRARADGRLDPRAHLRGRLVRERDRQDLVRMDVLREQVGDAVREHARLPGAGSGDDEERALRGRHGLALGVVQVGELELGGGLRRHHSTLARPRDVSAARAGTGAGKVRMVGANGGIELRGLAKSFGEVRAVRGIDFSVARGETVALLGPNGAGKSTTIDMVLGLLDARRRHGVRLRDDAAGRAVDAGARRRDAPDRRLIRDLTCASSSR